MTRGASAAVALLVVAVLVAGVGVPAGQFTDATATRDTGVTVVDDPDGVVGLEGATTLSDEGGSKRDDLANFTNRFDATVDVTVTLTSNTGTFDVCTPSRCAGDSITVTDVPSGGTRLFEVVKNGGGPGNEVSYRVTVTTTDGVTARLSRTATKGQGGGPGGTPPGQAVVVAPGAGR